MEANVDADKKVSKRLITNLPDRTHELLKAWAEKDGMSLSALAAHLLKVAADIEEREGRLSLDTSDDH